MSDKRSGNQGIKCEATEAQLFDYVDAVLSPSETQAINAHLAGCDRCRLEVEHIRRAESALLAGPIAITPPGDLYAGFAEKLAARQRKEPWIYLTSRFSLRYVAPAVALTTIALVLFRPAYLRPTTSVEPPKIAKRGPVSAAEDHTPPLARFGRDRAVAINSGATGEVRQDNYAFNLPTQVPIRNRKRSSGHQADIALIFAKVDHLTAHANVQGVTQEFENGVQLADNTPHLEYEAARYSDSAAPFAALESPHTSSTTNLYAYQVPDQRKQIVSTAQLDGMSVPIGINTAGGEFALVVQDDIRGFTAEAHNTDSSVPQASHTGPGADDGFKVEVEFDGAAGTTSF